MSAPSSILVSCSNRVVCIRVEGKGSFQNSAGMKEFGKEMMNRGHREFVIDLKNCPVMDSTFMGTLAGMALRLREIGQGQLHVINLNERNSDLLQNLGLDQLFVIESPSAKDVDTTTGRAIEDQSGGRDDRARTMLEAHEALVEADPENITKFKDVLDYLKQDLHVSD